MGLVRSTASLALLVVLSAVLKSSSAFLVPPRYQVVGTRTLTAYSYSSTQLQSSVEEKDEEQQDIDENALFAEVDETMKKLSVEERKERIGSLIADDEWLGLAVEMTEAVRTAVVQDVKKKQQAVVGGVKGKTTEFIGKEEYKVGDILKTLDAKVKNEVASLRGKDECESICNATSILPYSNASFIYL